MTIEEKVQALLAAALPVYGSPAAELVPAERILPPGDWQSLALPYVIHKPLSVSPDYSHSGRIALTPWLYQVSVFAGTYGEARRIAHAVVSSLDGKHDGVQFMWQGDAHLFESDVRVHHIAVTFQVFEAL